MVELPIISLRRKDNKNRPERPIYVGTMEDLIGYLCDEARAHSSLYHYTQWENFVKMMKPVDNGSCKGKRVMLLSSAARMNDGIEQKWGERVFFTCFSYSKYEDVAMWMNYGRKSPDAIRVRFDAEEVVNWYCKHRDKKIGIHRVKKVSDDSFDYSALNPDEIESIQLSDVAYVIDEKLMNEKHRGNIEYGRDFLRVEGDGIGFRWTNDVFAGNPRNTISNLPPFFKKRGWGYERETRLVVTLKEGVRVPNRLAIEFDEVFDRLSMSRLGCDAIDYEGGRDERYEYRDERSFGAALMRGPWFDNECCSSENINGMVIGQIRGLSDYKQEIGIINNGSRSPLQVYAESQNWLKENDKIGKDKYKVSDDDKDFLRSVRSILRCARKTIQYHLNRDNKPNKYKLSMVDKIDGCRLAKLSMVDKWAKQYLEVLHQIADSFKNGWKTEVNVPEKYGK